MMELDEKYASVILRRYVEDTGDSENVYVVRGGDFEDEWQESREAPQKQSVFSALKRRLETEDG